MAGLVAALIPAVTESAHADYTSYTRNGGDVHDAYYDSSVSSYGYNDHYDAARAKWDGITSKVSIGKSTSSSGSTVDIYYVGTSANAGLYGTTTYIVNSTFLGVTTHKAVSSESSNWDWCQVSLYDNNIRSEDHKDLSGIILIATHELGHTSGLLHTTDTTKQSYSVMTEGPKWTSSNWNLSGPTMYDQTELKTKWGN